MQNINHEFDIIGGNTESEYTEFSPQRLVNMFVVSHPEAVVKKAAFPTPGLDSENGTTFNIGGVIVEGRAAHLFKDVAYVVVKDQLYGVKSSPAAAGSILTHFLVGTIKTNTGYVGIDSLNNELMLVDGEDGWILDVSTDLFTEINDPNFPSGATDVVALGNRFVTNKGESNVFHYSEPGTGLTWGGLNFFSVSDTVVAFSTINGRMLVMSTTSTNPWYVAGGTAPFLPQLPSFDLGCAAVGSVAKGFGMVVWLSRTDKGVSSIVATTGGMPIHLSDESMDTEFDKYINVEDAMSYLYKNELGHIMYVINLTLDNKSWMYDFNTKKFSELSSEEDNRHLGNAYVYLEGRHYVLDYKAPKMYDMAVEYGTDDGAVIKRVITSPNFLFPNDVSIDWLEFIMKQGTGTQSGNDENPQARLRISKDGGTSYGAERSQPIGKIGRRLQKTGFDELGVSDSWIFEMTHYNITSFVLLGLLAHIGGKK